MSAESTSLIGLALKNYVEEKIIFLDNIPRNCYWRFGGTKIFANLYRLFARRSNEEHRLAYLRNCTYCWLSLFGINSEE
jgi:hypothetical protein